VLALPRPSWKHLGLLDFLVAALLAAAAFAHYRVCFGTGVVPEEDAAILMRYVRHLAAGHGVVWNVDEPPVDGATDFLFMVAAAAAVKAGASVEGATRGVSLLSHAATLALVYLAVRGLAGASRAAALFPAAMLALGPAPHYVAAAFGTPFFAFAVGLTWILAHGLLATDAPSLSRAMAFSASALVMGLIRPEGVIVAVLMLAAVLIGRRGNGLGLILAAFASVFLGLGLAYFLWRWSYFGHPLPNPFYKKGGGVLHWGTLAKAFQNLGRLCGPFALVIVAGLGHRPTRRYAVVALIPVVGFGLAWVLLSDETNYLMRFRYPIALVALVSWAPIWTVLRAPVARPSLRWAVVAIAWIVGLATLAWQYRRYASVPHPPSGLHDLAVALADYRDKGYTMAVTEAGLLPFYSDWRTVDAWGLNDPWITHNGGVTEEYLDRYRPDLVLLHAYYSPEVPRERGRSRGLGDAWYGMTTALQDYAVARHYELAAVFGRDSSETHYYYVRPGCPDAAALVARIRNLEYPWFRDGEPAVRYAARDSALLPIQEVDVEHPRSIVRRPVTQPGVGVAEARLQPEEQVRADGHDTVERRGGRPRRVDVIAGQVFVLDPVPAGIVGPVVGELDPCYPAPAHPGGEPRQILPPVEVGIEQ
jgi:arabinofuranosyltransferase